jgi:hypothetical protein
MRFLRRGETTLNEFWQDNCRSKCHDMLGTIYEWFYEGVLGVKAETEAYKTFRIKPPLGSEFGVVEGSVECPYGKIEVKYQRSEKGARMEVTVPSSATGYLILPNERSRVVVRRLGEGKGGYTEERGSERVELRPGRYELVVHL